jgi:serine/threonine protein kinase
MDGTKRMDTGTARMDSAKPKSQKTDVVFASGQSVDLNGRNCVIESTISSSSGEAVVYKAIIDSKPYALKLYKTNMPLSDTAKKVIKKIKDNPKDRIIKIYDFGMYKDQDFEIMEYAEGGTLEEYLKSNGAIKDTTKIKNIVKMITEGLQQLHSYYKVIYQDLKHENIYFRDADKTSIVLSDFGISSMMAGYDEEVEVTASITDLYAAPELAHKGTRNEVMVTTSVDYFALGITMIELWLGEKPFKGVKAAKRDYLITEEKVDLPIDMPDDYAALIQGLIKPRRKDRWGNEQVKKWLRGEAIAADSGSSKKADTVYDPLKFSNTESAVSPKELAALMEKYPDIGKTCLYDGIIKSWLQKAGDLMLYNKIQNIMSQYAKDKDSGLYAAILALDPEKPFKSRGGKICRTSEDIADVIMSESAYYMEDLKKPNANLYVYLEAVEGSQGKEAADAFCKYFKEYSPKRALALVYLKLQGDGGITIGEKHYQSPDELKKEKDKAQIDLIKKAVTGKDSILLVWLSDIYEDNLSAPEQFILLDLLPYLSFKDFNDSSWILQDLIDSCPERTDLFEKYASEGLPLTRRICDDKRTPIDYAVCNYKKLSKKHSVDTVRNMIRLLCKLGADVNEDSDDGTCPLINAYNLKNNDLVKLLLELGADENQYRVYKKRIIEEKQKEQERRTIFQNCIATSSFNTVGLKTDGTVVVIGDNNYGQCNTGSWRDIVAIATSSFHTVGLKADGTVVAVGNNRVGECDTGSWRGIVAVAADYGYTVGLKTDGTVVAIGDNKDGQCNTESWRDIIAVSAGSGFTVGLKSDGTVIAVGYNEYGQCNTESWRDIIAVSAGSGFTVGLKSDGTVIAVGYNEYGQCNTESWRDIVAVTIGFRYTVGLKADGTVVAIGDNKDGQCNTESWRDIVAVATSDDHTVGLKSDGTVVAVGKNEYGQCNTESWRDIVAVDVSGNGYTVVLKSDGTVAAFGNNEYGQCDTQDWRDIGPVPEKKRNEWKRRAEQERIEQERREEQERIERERREEQERIERENRKKIVRERLEKIERERREEQKRIEQKRKEQSIRWQFQGLCRYCGGQIGGLFKKKCKVCGREN